MTAQLSGSSSRFVIVVSVMMMHGQTPDCIIEVHIAIIFAESNTHVCGDTNTEK